MKEMRDTNKQFFSSPELVYFEELLLVEELISYGSVIIRKSIPGRAELEVRYYIRSSHQQSKTK